MYVKLFYYFSINVLTFYNHFTYNTRSELTTIFYSFSCYTRK